MLLSSLNTGSTDLRDTEVQQPNTAATLSLVISSRAFSANSGQLEAGSTTTASTFLPNKPPFLLRSSTIIRMVSFSVVSLIAIVPDSECSTPILIVPWVWASAAPVAAASAPAASTARQIPFKNVMAPSFRRLRGGLPAGFGRGARLGPTPIGGLLAISANAEFLGMPKF